MPNSVLSDLVRVREGSAYNFRYQNILQVPQARTTGRVCIQTGNTSALLALIGQLLYFVPDLFIFDGLDMCVRVFVFQK